MKKLYSGNLFLRDLIWHGPVNTIKTTIALSCTDQKLRTSNMNQNVNSKMFASNVSQSVVSVANFLYDLS